MKLPFRHVTTDNSLVVTRDFCSFNKIFNRDLNWRGGGEVATRISDPDPYPVSDPYPD